MTVPENRNSIGQSARRIVLLQQVSDRIGQRSLAKALDIDPRALRYKLSTERGVTDADLRCAIAVLEERGSALAALAGSIEQVLA